MFENSTFKMKKVQKFQPGMACWFSDLLTSSCRASIAESKAYSKPSFILLINSAHAAGLSFPVVQFTWTHLDCSKGDKPGVTTYSPVALVGIEVRLQFIQNRVLDLKEVSSRLSQAIRSDYLKNKPVLILIPTRGDCGVPVFDLFLQYISIRIQIIILLPFVKC